MAVQQQGVLLTSSALALPAPDRLPGNRVQQDPLIWRNALFACLDELSRSCDCSEVRAIAVDATSATLLHADPTSGRPLSPGLLYQDARAEDQLTGLLRIAPADAPVHAATSGLAKLLWLKQHGDAGRQGIFLHQADWLCGCLCGEFRHSDYHNALKTGYDASRLLWPQWLEQLGVDQQELPRVAAPGAPLAPVMPALRQRFRLARDCLVHAGTTDSSAAVLACGLHPNTGYSVLGSTLVCKLVSRSEINLPETGVYSHRFGDVWLVGGASNTGGAVLRHYWPEREIEAMTKRLARQSPEAATGLDYYPLLQPGERFPLNDPTLEPVLTPRPDDDLLFFRGILEGIAAIEARAYEQLAQLSQTRVDKVMSMGGASANRTWRAIRSARLGVPVEYDPQPPAVGTARLALRGHC